jgi:hypothetical protein
MSQGSIGYRLVRRLRAHVPPPALTPTKPSSIMRAVTVPVSIRRHLYKDMKAFISSIEGENQSSADWVTGIRARFEPKTIR